MGKLKYIAQRICTYVVQKATVNRLSFLASVGRYEYTFTKDRLWRKNRKRSVGSLCTGVDLNRNFGYRWGGLGTSKDPCREIYAGSGPFSEPETNAIRYFFEASSANFKVRI